MGKPTRTEYQSARILAALEGHRLTAEQLRERLHISHSGIHNYIRLLRKEGKIRICGFVVTKAKPFMVLELGNAPDAIYVRARHVKTEKESKRMVQRRRILELLKTPHSANTISVKLGLARTGVIFYLRALRSEGLVHIDHWKRSRANPTPHYVAGQGEDAPPPVRRTTAQRAARIVHQRSAWAAALLGAS